MRPRAAARTARSRSVASCTPRARPAGHHSGRTACEKRGDIPNATTAHRGVSAGTASPADLCHSGERLVAGALVHDDALLPYQLPQHLGT